MVEINLKLHKKQGVAFQSTATEILYGGAAGGGKSHLMRTAAIVWCCAIPGIQIYLFRRQYADLISNHMQGPGSFPELLADMLIHKKVTITGENSKPDINFWNGSSIHLRHCQHEKDVRNYQGAEIHVLLVDELTHFSEYIYRFLRGRLRLGGLQIPDGYKGLFPRILCGSNPGSVGHQWVKRTFIDMQKAFQIQAMPKDEGGMLRQYIPALLEDNPTLMQNDPTYVDRLEGLGSPDLVKAMRYGLWDITAGAALEKLSRDKHMIRRFKVPNYWTKFTVIDWGTAKPFAVAWFCVPDEDLELVAKEHWPARFIPKNSLIMYRELYGWSGKANEGCKWESFEVAKKILEIEEETGEHVDYRVGDSAMWAEHDGPSIAERMAKATKNRYVMQPSKKDREANYQEIRARLVGESGYPLFYTTEDCTHFWRTVPDLQLDENHPERGPDTTQEDHCFVAGTPIITEHGIKPIEQIADGTKVLTTKGFMPCINLGQTSIQKTYIIKFDDAEYEATGNHPFLTSSGMYVRLDSLCKTQSLYQIQNKNFLVNPIGSVENIFKGAVSDCIVRYGKFITETYQKAIMFITKMVTTATMQLKILNCLQPVIIYPNICKRKSASLTADCTLSEFDTLHQHGISPQKEGRGIPLMQKNVLLRLWKRNVAFAVKHFLLKNKQQNVVAETAKLVVGEKNILSIIPSHKEKPVYNLHVPNVNNFALGNGVIVHNCYDVLCYAVASRPPVTKLVDRQEREIQKYERLMKRKTKQNKNRYM